MSEQCKKVQKRVEQKVEKKIKEYEKRKKKKCRHESCNWWTLCLNKVFCWFVWIVVTVVRTVVVTVGKWVQRVVCEVIDYVWNIITTLIGNAITFLESYIGWILDAVAYLVDLIFSIPYLGPFLHELWNGLLFLGSITSSSPDIVLGILGFRPEKKLKVGVICFTVDGKPICDVDKLIAAIQKAIDVYKDEANVRILPLKPFKFSVAFDKRETADRSWIHFVKAPKTPDVLDVKCEAAAWGEDFSSIGSYYELIASTSYFYGNARALIGYGAPVIVFAVRDVKDKSGCSLGPLVDYVTLKATMPKTFKHEVGHACNLWHCCGPDNMMNGTAYPPGNHLNLLQIVVLRASKHVTYF